jgi:glycogen debranching enzyme
VLPGSTATVPTPIGFDRETVGELAVAEAREWLVTTGTWLIGPFVDAHLRVRGDAVAARRFLDPFGHHLRTAGLGTVSEIFDGNAPLSPKGCIAQAWSVGDLRVTAKLDHQPTPSGSPTSSEESVSA